MIDFSVCVSSWREERLYALSIEFKNCEKNPSVWIMNECGINEQLSLCDIYDMCEFILNKKYSDK